MAVPGDCRCGRACWEWDYTEADEISLVLQAVRRFISWPEMVTNGGHCWRPTYLPSNHTESTWKLTLSIRPPAVYENRHKLANVCEVTLWFAYMNLGTLPCRKCGIPSICLCYDRSVIWATAVTLQLKKCDILGKDAFFPLHFPLKIYLPVRMLRLCNYAVMYVDIFYSIWYLPKLSNGVSPWEIWNGKEAVFFFSNVVARTREIQSQEDDGWF